MLRGLHHVADHVEREAIAALIAIRRDADADGTVGDGRAIQRDARFGRRRYDPVFLAVLAELQAEQIEELARGVGARLIERSREAPDPLIVLAKLLLVGQHVVHAVHQILGQQHVVDGGRSLVVKIPHRLVEVVKEIGAGGDQAIDEPVFDHADHQAAHPGRNHGAGHPHHDGAAVAQHALPDFECQPELFALECGALHARQDFGGAGCAHRIERAGGRGQQARLGLRIDSCMFWRALRVRTGYAVCFIFF